MLFRLLSKLGATESILKRVILDDSHREKPDALGVVVRDGPSTTNTSDEKFAYA